jgi:acetolactate synthase regulatory subunit
MYQLGFLLASFAIVGVLKQVFFISEGWMNMTQDGKQPEIRPSLDPQRTEVLLISQLNVINDLAKVVLLEMKRDTNGTLYALENVDGRLPEPESSVKSPLLEAFAIGFLGFTHDTKH